MKIHITNCNKKAPYHYVNLLADAFMEAGHDVFRFDDADYSSFNLTADRIIRRSPLYLLHKKQPGYFDFKQKHKDFIGRQWIKSLKDYKPDAALVINTGWLSAESVKIAKESLNIPRIICWIVDDPGNTPAEDLAGALPYCDTIFSTDPGWVPFIRFFNENVHYLPLATSKLFFKPLDIERDLDFSFVGSFFMKDPAGFLRAYIISQLPSQYDVEIYGPGIEYYQNIYPKLKQFKCFTMIINAEKVNNIWNRSKLTATIYNPQVRDGSAPRVFDTALAKTPQIIQYTPTIKELYPDIEVPTFHSIPDFLSKADYHISHQKESRELAEAMYEATGKRHLFIHRVKTIMDTSYD